MWLYAVTAVLDAAFGVSEATFTPVAQRIQRAIAKQTVKMFFLDTLMARKIFTLFILKKSIIRHIHFLHDNRLQIPQMLAIISLP